MNIKQDSSDSSGAYVPLRTFTSSLPIIEVNGEDDSMEDNETTSDDDKRVPFANVNSIDGKVIETDKDSLNQSEHTGNALETDKKGSTQSEHVGKVIKGMLHGQDKLDSHSTGSSQPGSRKVSFYTDAHGNAHPIHQNELLHPYMHMPFVMPGSRKVSTNSFGFNSNDNSRKTSMEAFMYPQPAHFPMHRLSQIQHGKVSVFSIGNQSECSTLQGDAYETLPSIDNYSNFDIRQRPTLYQLREDDKNYMAEAQETQLHMCAQCGKGYKHRRNLTTHEQTHNGTLSLSCCDLSFPSRRSLQRHRCAVHGDTKSHVSSESGKEFATRADLSQHETRERRDERQFSCDICGAHIVRKTEVRLHMARHTDDAEYILRYLSEPISADGLQSDLFSDELYDDPDVEGGKTDTVVAPGLKFGWIQGVLVRCLLNIFGVMLFLRLSWVTGQAGIGLATVIVALAGVVTSITTMSMSAICTNGEVKGGGAYYMISRSLGPEFGGSIGIVFALANAIGAAMYIVGFAETVRDIMWENGVYITGDSIHEVRIIGIAVCCLCLAIVLIGMEWEAKAQLGLMFILMVAIVNFFVGTFIPPDDEKKWKGVVGYNSESFTTNFVPHFTTGNSFFSVFAIFFPAATGVLAGANISGDLKDAQTAIPKGTFLAILLTSLVYIAMLWCMGACSLLNAVGPAASSILIPGTNTTISPNISIVQECYKLSNASCEYGLHNDIGLVGIAAAWRPLILAGIFSATLSSALASMVGAPKVFQALAKDKLFPYIHVFAKGFGASGEPRRAYFLCFIICIAMVCIGSLDLIAPIISNFFLMAYAMINFSCFDASIADSPGFRPGFKYYNKWISLIGSLLCVAVMFLINWWAALATYVICGGLYFYVKRSKPDVNWGSSTQANVYRDALKFNLRLMGVDEHVKNFRPQILALTGYPRNRANLVDFASVITKKQSLLICGHVFQGDLAEHLSRIRSLSAYRWLASRKVKGFYNNVCAPTFRIGVQVLLQALGIGKLRPNVLLMGYKCDWQKADPRDVLDYFNVIQDAFDLSYGVGVLRVPGGLDRNKVPDDMVEMDDEIFGSDVEDVDEHDNDTKMTNDVTKTDNNGTDVVKKRKSAVSVDHTNSHGIRLQRLNTLEEGQENVAFDPDLCTPANEKPPLNATMSLDNDPLCRMFHEKQYGTIDVWWLYDDGGLTLLIPYILSQRKQWKHCKLRVFCIGTSKEDVTEDQQRMASLLAKFRIDYEQLTVITEMNKKPQLKTYREFESLIHQWRLKPGEFQEEYLWKIADADLIEHKQKTYRHLRLREKLIEHSKDASLIVMTLPVPRKSMCPAGLYMGWLEILTKGMPPILLLRGNQQSVLTYYS